MADQFYYASMEWVWSEGQIRINIPGADETLRSGTYQEVVDTLTQLGQQGWEVVTAVAGSNWIYWTLKLKGQP